MIEDDAITIAQQRAHITVLTDAHDAVLRIHSRRGNASDGYVCRECANDWPCPTVDALGGGI